MSNKFVRHAPIEVDHNAKLIVCSVLRDEEDNVTYAIYLKDAVNLPKPIGFDLRVMRDGHIKSFFQGSDAEDLLMLLDNPAFNPSKQKSHKKKQK